MATNLAKVRTTARGWRRQIILIEHADAYQLALFIFMHELYHLLVKRARRNTRQKESMCDRFAARFLVDHYHTPIRDSRGRPVPREVWDFQDLDGFVAAARSKSPQRRAARIPIRAARPTSLGERLLLDL